MLLPTHSVFFSLFHRVFHINCTESAEGKGRRIKCIIIFNFDKAPIFLFFFFSLPSHLAGVGRRPRTQRCERRQALHVDLRQQAKVTEKSGSASPLRSFTSCFPPPPPPPLQPFTGHIQNPRASQVQEFHSARHWLEKPRVGNIIYVLFLS